jgi:Na+/H+ antiporter NhaD/arsenite permease-like protein
VAQVQQLLPAARLSAFVSNSPVVAMFTVAVQNWCKRTGFKSSQLLLLLTYASMLGGVCTLIGTSTNLVVDGTMRHQRFSGFSLFKRAWVGALMVVGFLYL